MTQVKQYDAKTEVSHSISDTSRVFGTRSTNIAIAILLTITLFGASGCSKTKSKNANLSPSSSSSNQNPQNTTNQRAGVLPRALPKAVELQLQKSKKVVKRLPSILTYSEDVYGISFQYPRKYTLKTGDKAMLHSPWINFAGPGGVTVATIELPASSYIGTDLYSASFNVSVNKNLTSEQCQQFALPDYSLARPEEVVVLPAKMNIQGSEFSEIENANEQEETKYYHHFKEGICYEFAFDIKRAETEPMDEVRAVNREEVFSKFEKILATVKIKSAAASEVATSTPGHPSPDGSNR